MGRRHFKPEQIIHMLREAEIKLAGGKKIGEVCRELGISEQSYYRWRNRVRRDAGLTSEEAQGSAARERTTEEAGGRSGVGQGHS